MRLSTSVLSFVVLISAASIAAAAEPTHEYFTTKDGVKIHYMQLGDKGSYVVLIHGFTGSAEGNWFSNGIAEALAKNHRVVAIDCRNHGRSDKPEPGHVGKADDVIELMDHLKIEKAHIHGYSMGGGITGQLMAKIPDRFITAAFGGSGVRETDPEMIKQLPPDKKGTDPQEAEASRKLRIHNAMNNGKTQEEAEKLADAPPAARPARPAGEGAARSPEGPKIDLTTIKFPVLAINGELDSPNAKTTRMKRELKNFKSVVLPGKSHLTAIMAGYIPKEYGDSLVTFINANDAK